jgi:hypothetical protein
MSKTAPGSDNVSGPYCPNTSMLIAPTSPAHTRKHLATAESSPSNANSSLSRPKSDDSGCGTTLSLGGMSPAAMPAAMTSNRAQVAGDRPQRQTGSTLGVEMTTAELDDLAFDAVTSLLTLAHTASVAQTEITALVFEAMS